MGPALVSSSVSSHSSDQEPSQDFTDNRFDLTSNLTKLVHSPTCKSSLTSVIVGARKKNPAFHLVGAYEERHHYRQWSRASRTS